jgi:cell division transport system permease protein
VSTITGALTILGVFSIVSYNLNSVMKNLQGSLSAEVFLADNLDETSLTPFLDSLKNLEFIDNVSFISKDSALSIFKKDLGEEMLLGLSENPLPASIFIMFSETNDLENAVNELFTAFDKDSRIQNAYLPTKTIYQLAEMKKIYLKLTFAWSLIILFSSIFIISNTTRLTMLTRKNSLEIMTLFGAEPSLIRLPLILEGIFQGATSGVLAWAIIRLIEIGVFFFYPAIVPLPLSLILAISTLGLIFGFLGSYISIRRFI